MFSKISLHGIVLSFLIVAVMGQGFINAPVSGIHSRQGSISKATSKAFEREINYGPVEVNQGVSNSRLVTKTNGGLRNGGTTSISRSNAISRDVDIGGLNIGGTLTRSQTRTNGAVSRGLAYDANIGNLGFGASISPNNLRNGFGLMRQPAGGVSLGLGLINLDISRNAQVTNNALTQAQVNVQGQNARTHANSNTQTQMQNYGGVGVTTTKSRSNAVGHTQFGRTSALTSGVGGTIATNTAYRPRREALPKSESENHVVYNRENQIPSIKRHLHYKNSTWFDNEPMLTKSEVLRFDDLNTNAMSPPTEKFDVIDNSQKQGRTFNFITDLIDSFTARCVYPCTAEAYQQNRCCEAVIVVPPEQPICCKPPIPPPQTYCCGVLPVSQYPLPLPQPRRRIVVVPTGIPINCCVTCASNGYFGPPPCVRYGIGGTSIGTISGTSVAAWSSSSMGSIGQLAGYYPYSPNLGNIGQLPNYSSYIPIIG